MCLLLFLTGAAAAPHRHKNDLADLLTQAPSDSGVFLDVAPIAPRDAIPLAESARWVDDDPCPACFGSDFATTAAAAPYRVEVPPLRDCVAILPCAEAPSDRLHLHSSRSPPSA